MHLKKSSLIQRICSPQCFCSTLWKTDNNQTKLCSWTYTLTERYWGLFYSSLSGVNLQTIHYMHWLPLRSVLPSKCAGKQEWTTWSCNTFWVQMPSSSYERSHKLSTEHRNTANELQIHTWVQPSYIWVTSHAWKSTWPMSICRVAWPSPSVGNLCALPALLILISV